MLVLQYHSVIVDDHEHGSCYRAVGKNSRSQDAVAKNIYKRKAIALRIADEVVLRLGRFHKGNAKYLDPIFGMIIVELVRKLNVR